jgi:hypothetical protein
MDVFHYIAFVVQITHENGRVFRLRMAVAAPKTSEYAFERVPLHSS